MSDVCQECGGSGTVPVGEEFVTHDMALDAQEPSMEGMSLGVVFGPCDACGGYGVAASQPPTEGQEDR